MSPDPQIARLTMAPARLLRLTLVALLLATGVFVAFVLPAEFRIDPTGIGHATGLVRLAGPRVLDVQSADESGAAARTGVAVRYYTSPYRKDFVDVPLTSAEKDPENSELEYKVRLKAGATLVYSFEVPEVANAEEFYFDFHGEADAKGADGEAVVVEYLQTTGTRSSGMLVAPFDGIYGWYLQNQSVEPVVVRLQLSGFYELIPPGDNGNRARIQANRPVTDPTR